MATAVVDQRGSGSKPPHRIWRVLMDTRSPWLVEFARAFERATEATVYSPEIQMIGRLKRNGCRESHLEGLRVLRFPLQRGYFSHHFSSLLFEDHRILQSLGKREAAAHDPLVCCLPHYARVAEKWPGPLVYYPTDLYRAYEGWDPAHISQLERRICRVAELVCPNSTRIADVLTGQGGCDPDRILVLPNAVREENLLTAPAMLPAELPADLEGLKRPIAGVIGNLGENTDWVLLEQVVHAAPWLSWVFVGPYSAPIHDPTQASARKRLLQARGRARFTGTRKPNELKDYARAVDVAVLPYRKREPTYSGSSTRFYEHLAACRPMISTRGFEELLHKEPYLHLVDTGKDFIDAVNSLRTLNFNDGLEEKRWKLSLENTWSARAGQMCEAIESRTREPQRTAGLYANG